MCCFFFYHSIFKLVKGIFITDTSKKKRQIRNAYQKQRYYKICQAYRCHYAKSIQNYLFHKRFIFKSRIVWAQETAEIYKPKNVDNKYK